MGMNIRIALVTAACVLLHNSRSVFATESAETTTASHNRYHHDNGYRIVPRRTAAQTMVITMNMLKQLEPLSWSEDSEPVSIDTFYLQVFSTSGTLSTSAVATVENGLSEFLKAELNTMYDVNHRVRSVKSSILTQTMTASSRRLSEDEGGLQPSPLRRQLEETGSQLETAVDVQFNNAPVAVDAQAAMVRVLSGDLTPLLNNITAMQHADLDDATVVYYLPRIPDGDGIKEAGGVAGVVDTQPIGVMRRRRRLNILVPVLVCLCLLCVVVALLSVRRRHRDASASVNEAGLVKEYHRGMKNDLEYDEESNLHWDANSSNGIFSVEDALADMSRNPSKKTSRNRRVSTSAAADDASDIFSGIGGSMSASNTTQNVSQRSIQPQETSDSPRGGASVFSFFSGLGSRGSRAGSRASTVKAGNRDDLETNGTNPIQNARSPSSISTKNRGNNSNSNGQNATSSDGGAFSGTPHSRVSSLFTFSEEESVDLISDPIVQPIATAPSDEEQSYSESMQGSEEERANTESGFGKIKTAFNATGVTLSALAAGAVMRGRSPKKSSSAKSSPTKSSPSKSSPSKSSPSKSSPAKSLKLSPEKTDNKSLQVSTRQLSSEVFQSPLDTPLSEKKRPPMISTDDITRQDEDEVSSSTTSGSANAETDMKQRLITQTTQSTHQSPPKSTSKKGWSMNMFPFLNRSNKKEQSNKSSIESPAVHSYHPTTGATPESMNSFNTDPGPNQNVEATASPTEQEIYLEWGDPCQAATNKAQAAAFAGTVSGAADEMTSRGVTASGMSPTTAGTGLMGTVTRKAQLLHGTAGNADGTHIYQNDAAQNPPTSTTSSNSGSLSFSRGRGKPLSPKRQIAIQGDANVSDLGDESMASGSPRTLERFRRHAKSTGMDGTNNYQNETMADWSVASDLEEPILADSTKKDRQYRMKTARERKAAAAMKPPKSPRADASHKSGASNSIVSGLSIHSPIHSPSANSDASPSQQLISDLLWLENKIAATNQAVSSPKKGLKGHRDMSMSDSLSFASGEDGPSGSSLERPRETDRDDDDSMNQSIVCRDCYAPPGKLKIVIHSTKDGPAVHTVKKGSSLEGHVFPGDLIISVDNVDTRSYSAEQVMKMMTAKTRFERKITVLHFENAGVERE